MPMIPATILTKVIVIATITVLGYLFLYIAGEKKGKDKERLAQQKRRNAKEREMRAMNYDELTGELCSFKDRLTGLQNRSNEAAEKQREQLFLETEIFERRMSDFRRTIKFNEQESAKAAQTAENLQAILEGKLATE